MQPMTLFALCGSLRQTSINKATLHALQTLAPASVRIVLDEDIGLLPLFNPDIEHLSHPAVERIKRQLAEASGLIIASPEYAHGITGVLKNALDWLVSGPEFVDKPIMLINTSARAYHAQQALREVVTTMSGKLIDDACVTVPLLSKTPTADDIVQMPDVATALTSGLATFCEAIHSLR
ncbi:NADPH-dependent FMN reductase [Thalassolituus sp. LLYu03]|uniref:NADPH-dependent FMN reductase n=1 Tax=Thalassolituus sp. LLYu03 TaxID=3421656 RepID=UPI003D2BD3C6